ncbi:MAG: diguanylate cyclase [Proteobacteria bacterium]|nr:diguanylate cyclase [Pseudomonadota bacterium]
MPDDTQIIRRGHGTPVLIVEDVGTEAFTLRKVLERADYEVTLATSGQEALRLLAMREFKLVITDIDMPGMDGYAMCLAIKESLRTRTIPVILLTTLSSPANILQGLKCKADYYLTKPYTPSLLLARVQTLLERPPTPPDADAEPIPVVLEGHEHAVTAGRRQLVNIILSTYECAVQQNRELIATQAELNHRNEQLRVQQDQLRIANEQLQALATTDGLTGLKNHRTFKERLADEFHRASRYHLPLSFILLDVDHFKKFNDAHGHPAGDEVLKRVAKHLTESTRSTDFVARYGGEEFAMLLPFTHQQAALALAERTRAAIQGATWELRAVTASFGVATLNADTPTAAALIKLADDALYHSKENGRNRVTHASELTNA